MMHIGTCRLVSDLWGEVKRLREALDVIRDHTNHGNRDDGSCEEDGGECVICSVLDCPFNDPLHYHHDGCPSEWAEGQQKEKHHENSEGPDL